MGQSKIFIVVFREAKFGSEFRCPGDVEMKREGIDRGGRDVPGDRFLRSEQGQDRRGKTREIS